MTNQKEMEEYLDQFENVMDVPMATLTEEQREVLTEIVKERYRDFIKRLLTNLTTGRTN